MRHKVTIELEFEQTSGDSDEQQTVFGSDVYDYFEQTGGVSKISDAAAESLSKHKGSLSRQPNSTIRCSGGEHGQTLLANLSGLRLSATSKNA